ncbi:hypothetical protein [Kineococcus indalonis]|uniref:hypothetical protein n=1 Tax=Kineococcus indalonis TaxID=2696566 RepID=UPI001411CFA2|nr:hypothetical protein [Kineococcus indalonis]NAZ88764.1 hypothetical protein [Kineococcus indalonis]
MAHEDATSGGTGSPGARPVMEMLSEHIPLSLIMDMVSPEGPHSEELLVSEGLPDQEWWKRS